MRVDLIVNLIVRSVLLLSAQGLLLGCSLMRFTSIRTRFSKSCSLLSAIIFWLLVRLF